MGQLFETVKQFFEKDGWGYREVEGDTALMLMFGGKSGEWRCYARVIEDRGYVQFFSYAPFDVPEERFQSVMELMARINFGLNIGSFDLNLADGTLQFKTSIDVEGTEASLTPQLIKNTVYSNALTMDGWLAAIGAVVEGKMMPEEAVKSVRGR